MTNPLESSQNYLLDVKDLSICFQTRKGIVEAVSGISFSLPRRSSLAFWGHSGCGKTTLFKAILGLPLSEPGIVSGYINYGGESVLPRVTDYVAIGSRSILKDSVTFVKTHADLVHEYLGTCWRIIWQEPIYSFEPGRTIEQQSQAYFSRISNSTDSRLRILTEEFTDTLSLLNLDYNLIKKKTNLSLSGGECQRIMVAMSLVGQPELLLADEPTTALDETTRRIISDCILRKQEETGMSLIVASHNRVELMGLAERIVVLCNGRVVEKLPCQRLSKSNPSEFHPYTQSLWFMNADIAEPHHTLGMLSSKGKENGCPYVQQCSFVQRDEELRTRCTDEIPTQIETHPDHVIACLLFENNRVTPSAPSNSIRTDRLTDDLVPKTNFPSTATRFIEVLCDLSSLEAIDVGKYFSNGYDQKKVILHDVTFFLPRSKIIGLIGKTGVGKTTLGKLLAGLWKPDSGKVRIGNIALDSLLPKEFTEVRRWIRYVPQNPDAVVGAQSSVHSCLEEAAALSRLTSAEQIVWAKVLENSDTISSEWRSRKFGDLSLGQRRRVINYRGLTSCPGFLIMDEPFNGLDEVAKERMLNLFEYVSKQWGTGILLISHDQTALECVCDGIWKLVDGTLVPQNAKQMDVER